MVRETEVEDKSGWVKGQVADFNLFRHGRHCAGGSGFLARPQGRTTHSINLNIQYLNVWSCLVSRLLLNFVFPVQIKGSWLSKRGAEDSGNPYTYDNIFTNCCAPLCGPMPPRSVCMAKPPRQSKLLLSYEMYLSSPFVKLCSRVAQQSKALHLSAKGVTTVPGLNPGCITSGCDCAPPYVTPNQPSVVQVWPG